MSRKRQSNILLSIIAIWAATLACGVSDILGPGATPTRSGLLFYDDFSNPESGWDQNSEGGVMEYYQGTYHIRIDGLNMFSWSLAYQSFGDVIIRVNLAYTGSAENAEMGVICRLQDNSHFYLFTIRSDGDFAILKMTPDGDDFIGMEGYLHSPAINTGIATNYLEVRCVGNQLIFIVNEQHLITVQDSSYLVGDVGVIAGSFDHAGVDVFFDDFEVHQP